ncbi:MAG: phosphoribosylanthranilate isomerase [Betaproteobacteria bacterium]|nr:phosphoribosylanthranilate isomerase [Betaproteobacteria bacterium]
MRTRIKMCGITRRQDAECAVRAGSDALGFIFWPSSARYIAPAEARDIIRDVGPFVATVGVFVNPAANEVRAAISAAGISALQFHGEEDADFCGSFGLPFLKAFKVGQGRDLLKSLDNYEAAAGWLFDAFDPRLVGGTGEAFDWSLIPAGLARPLVLSGGLHTGNVGEAIRRVRPFAVDVSSGIETGKGIKSAEMIAAFVQGVRNADQ